MGLGQGSSEEREELLGVGHDPRGIQVTLHNRDPSRGWVPRDKPLPPLSLATIQLLAEKVGGWERALVEAQLFHPNDGKTKVPAKKMLHD